MPKPTVKRSACDPCRAKRVRCLRAQDSMAPCARCCYIGARCVTGASGHPGRPPKKRLANSDSTPRGTSTCPSDVSSPSSRCQADRHTLGNRRLDDIAGPDLAVPKSPVHHPHSPRDNHRPLAHEQPQPDFWVALGDSSAFFGSPSIDQNPPPSDEMLSLADQLSNSPSQFQGLLSADDELNAMLHMGGDSSTAVLDMDIDPLLHHTEVVLPPTPPLSQCFSAASSLVGFREEIDQRIARIEAFYAEPSKVVQRCKDEGVGQDVENPAGSLLVSSRELIDIVQGLTPLDTQTEDALSTEIVLLALSSYLALMRLFDFLFHRIYKYLCKVPPESWQSMKVKSVLLIGGVSSLQDMPLKAYAMGVLDAIQAQVQTLERCMGIPAEYCLSGEAAAASPTAARPGILSRADRAQLFWAVIAQEDVKSQRDSKSYIESIRASIKDSLAFLDN